MRTPTTTPAGSKLRQLFERSDRVFPSYPQVTRYFPAPATEDARQRLSRAIDRGDGPGLVIGAPGTGKSLLLQVLAAQYHERFDIVLMACARLCTRRALLQAILFELGLPYKAREEGELRLSLLDHLLSAENCPAGLLLLVDEAQSLPAALLDELRVMTNLVRAGTPRVRLVLAGSAALEECFAHPDLESFSQRLSARCYLAPLGREDTCRFIQAQIAAAGVKPGEVIADDAWDAVFEATDGVPRLVNQLCDRSLCDAVAAGRARIDRQAIQRAWSELQQLPTPWEVPEKSTAAPVASQVVEFGALAPDDRGQSVRDDDSEIQLAPEEALDEFATDIDATELDYDDVEIVAKKPAVAPIQERGATVAINPFAEQFDDEEVVLDNFAAWDNMFRPATPRVRNQRDPGFATMVQAAIDASPRYDRALIDVSTTAFTTTSTDAFDTADVPNSADEQNDSEASSEANADWPPLRLAIVSDSEHAQPEPSVTSIGRYADAIEQMLLKNDLVDWPAGRRTATINRARNRDDADESPVLVIEEGSDGPRPAPTVRREEYRHLFTRLRSG